MNKFPPVDINNCITSNTTNIPALYAFKHIDVNAEVQNPSPEKLEWMKAYFVNCLINFSTNHAKQFLNDTHDLINMLESELINCCLAETNHKNILSILASVTRSEPIATVPRQSKVLNKPLPIAWGGPNKSFLPSWYYYHSVNMLHNT